jgi:FtsH-binding integral membrane protein
MAMPFAWIRSRVDRFARRGALDSRDTALNWRGCGPMWLYCQPIRLTSVGVLKWRLAFLEEYFMATFQGNNTAFRGSSVDSRALFITRTYTHVVGGILGFILVELGLFESGLAEQVARFMLGFNWFLILGAFMLVGWLATRTAQTSSSIGMQYFAYAAYVVAEALIFVPLLYIADAKAPGAIDSATLITALGAGGLMFVAHRTRKDFSFLRAVLMWGGVVAILAMIGGAIFGFQLGTWFSVAMIGFAGAAVLYDTSNIIHYYPEDRYVSAAMQLFASIALMFWYVLRLVMGNRN